MYNYRYQVLSKSKEQKKSRKKLIFCWHLELESHGWKEQDPDPWLTASDPQIRMDPNQNFSDLIHCFWVKRPKLQLEGTVCTDAYRCSSGRRSRWPARHQPSSLYPPLLSRQTVLKSSKPVEILQIFFEILNLFSIGSRFKWAKLSTRKGIYFSFSCLDSFWEVYM